MPRSDEFGPPLSAEPDLIARGAQARNEPNPEALQLGGEIYRRIVDNGDEEELARLQRLAALSEAGVRPQIVEAETEPPRAPRRVLSMRKKLLLAILLA